MSQRKTLKDSDSAAFDTLLGFETYLAKSSLSKTHGNLIKIRVSQINGCSFCIDKHIKEALSLGESSRRIFLLSQWRETTLYSLEEQVILELAEEITVLTVHGVSDAIYDKALALLGQNYLTSVIMGIIAMNAWNRVGIATGRKPE